MTIWRMERNSKIRERKRSRRKGRKNRKRK